MSGCTCRCRKSTIAKKDKTKGFAGVADPKNREF
jgi:hypothetical protein